MRGKYWLIGLTVVIVAGLGLRFKPGGAREMPMGITTHNLAMARVFGIAAMAYAGDHHGSYPAYLKELVPDYIAAANWDQMLYSTQEPGGKLQPRYDWLYFAAGHDEKHLPHITIASPQAVNAGGVNKRIVTYDDCSVATIPEDVYQRELNLMMEAMRKTPAPTVPTTTGSGSVPHQ